MFPNSVWVSSKHLADTLLSIFAGEEVIAVWRGMSGFASDGVRLLLPAVLAPLLTDDEMVMDFLEPPLSGMPGMLSIPEAPFTFWGTKGFSFLHYLFRKFSFLL